MTPERRTSCRRTLLTTALVLVASPAVAAPQPLINYFQPMPIVGKLSTTVWGASAVGPRDPANGLEDSGASGGVGPQQETYFYWDGKIIKGEDGKFHMYASHWNHSIGFGPPAGGSTGWETSIPMQAISDDVMGPYISQGNCYAKNQAGNDEGHNVTAVVAPTGASPYTLSVGEIVPGQMFGSSSANGPWTLLGLVATNSNGHGACGDLSSNFTLTVGSDEDEVIWYSGGYYHIVYNYWNVQRAYHIMSKDGIHNWTSTGLAYQGTQSPENASSKWLRYTDGTVNQWHNMERPGVYQENGHVTHFTFAVTDTNKNATGVSSGGSKVLVVPFNGVQFDCDNGDADSCATPTGGGGAGGSSSGGGSNGAGGAGGAAVAGAGGDNGRGGAGGAAVGGAGGSNGRGGEGGGGAGTAGRGAGNASGSGGNGGSGGSGPPTSTGGSAGGRTDAGIPVAGGGTLGGGSAGAGGQTTGPVGGVSGNPGSSGASNSGAGCGCEVSPPGGPRAPIAVLLLVGFVGAVRRRARR